MEVLAFFFSKPHFFKKIFLKFIFRERGEKEERERET